MGRSVKHLEGKRIFVGLSGGVDSAVTAALLQRAGANVTGVFIKGWYPPGLPCTWARDRRDAMRVAAHLHIPFITLDASAEYKKGVIDYLLREYKAGRTPNPDIMCNRDVKFGAFYNFARAHGADFIATGHYARVSNEEVAKNAAAEQVVRENVPPRSGLPVEQRFSQLLRGIDPKKDQSYFLWAISKDALAHTLFPLGGFEKTDVRALAKKFKLPVKDKPDSQGICFLGSISVDEFLKNEFGPSEGKVLSENGTVIGTHEGAILATLGQRIAVGNDAPGPWYVIRKDIEKNTLTVSHTPVRADQSSITLEDTNWFDTAPEGTAEAQYRYHGPIVSGTFDEHTKIFTFSVAPEEPVASGQSLVLYRGERCIGGGIMA